MQRRVTTSEQNLFASFGDFGVFLLARWEGGFASREACYLALAQYCDKHNLQTGPARVVRAMLEKLCGPQLGEFSAPDTFTLMDLWLRVGNPILLSQLQAFMTLEDLRIDRQIQWDETVGEWRQKRNVREA